MKYYTADLHLFHKNVTNEGKNFDGRPFDTVEQMHNEIARRWNDKVERRDTVYILGDVSLKKSGSEALLSYLSELKGHKILIKGNHDYNSDEKYLKVFEEVCNYKEIIDEQEGNPVKLALCHYPILMWKNQHSGAILLYGHVHNSAEYNYFQKCVDEMNSEDFAAKIPGGKLIRAYNVGCMLPYMDYTPKSLDEIIRGADSLK